MKEQIIEEIQLFGATYKIKRIELDNGRVSFEVVHHASEISITPTPFDHRPSAYEIEDLLRGLVGDYNRDRLDPFFDGVHEDVAAMLIDVPGPYGYTLKLDLSDLQRDVLVSVLKAESGRLLHLIGQAELVSGTAAKLDELEQVRAAVNGIIDQISGYDEAVSNATEMGTVARDAQPFGLLQS